MLHEKAEYIAGMQKGNWINYEYKLLKDEPQVLAKPENRMKFYAAPEKFLAKHLGGRYEEAQE